MSAKMVDILKVVLITYVITGVLLVLLAFGLYKMQLSKEQIDIGIIIVYAISTIAGGYIIGKKKMHRRLLWGLLIGLTYFVVLSLIAFIVHKGVYVNGASAMKAALVCSFGGIVGGVIS
ncbi:TIGR04086 family membrane protein [[Clostridium] fimetarium]|uniref:Putative membrane protein, TIGR04086 family n=1 Tax=[Clostridium] fimetarium TaxID=99656 RepID=A0A1I0QC78_9FIRM|nr:TIGR04086 family membrane protein [[Clostridium] fimetarium]SEW24592.1 putative membrane protein, TIGR04086 family [[Clostridium] fimetarium]